MDKQKEEKSQTENNDYYDQNPHRVRTFLAWTAPGRPFKKKSRQYFITAILITILIEVLLFLFSQYVLMMVVLSLVFLTFSLATVPPANFHYRISTEGIMIENHFFIWQELYDFYFRKREGVEVLHVRTHAFIPGELTLTFGDLNKEQIKNVLLPYLPYREVVEPTFMEKSGEWLTRTFPLEKS